MVVELNLQTRNLRYCHCPMNISPIAQQLEHVPCPVFPVRPWRLSDYGKDQVFYRWPGRLHPYGPRQIMRLQNPDSHQMKLSRF